MYTAGHVGFLPENAHLTSFSFLCIPFLSTLQYKPHQIYATKRLTPFGIQPAGQKSQALQVVPVQRRPEDRYRCLFDVIYKHIIISINIQSPVSRGTAGIKQVRRQFSCSGCLLSSNTHPHPCFSFVLWSLAWLYCEGRFFPLPNTVTRCHSTWHTS